MSPLQPENKLRVARDGKDVLFPVSLAAYNWKRKKHGVEFTLKCQTTALSDKDYPPNLEVTIVLAEEPEIKVGSEWLNQPAYIDRDPLYNVTNYYEWAHEGIEKFSVNILRISGDTITCNISGYVSLNTTGDDPRPVSIMAEFKRENSLSRGVW